MALASRYPPYTVKKQKFLNRQGFPKIPYPRPGTHSRWALSKKTYSYALLVLMVATFANVNIRNSALGFIGRILHRVGLY